MNRTRLILTAYLILLVWLAGCANPTPHPQPQITLDLRPTQTEIPTSTGTPTVTITPSVTPTATSTPRPTRTATLAPTHTATLPPVYTLTPTLSLMPAGPFKTVARLTEITPGLVSAIYIPPIGNQVLLAGTFGMTRIDLTTLLTYSERYWGQSLGVDQSGRAWALPLGGGKIAGWEDNSWREYGLLQGWVIVGHLPTTPITSSLIVSGMDDTLWLATATDVRRFDGKQWFIYPATSTGISLPYKYGIQSALTVTARQDTPEAWAGSCNWSSGEIVGGGGLRYFDGHRWGDAGFPERSACILTLKTAPSSTVWAAVSSDLWQYNPSDQSWQHFPPPVLSDSSQHYSHILDLVIDPQGKACPLLRIEDSQKRPLKEIRYCLQGETWKPVRTLGPLASQSLRFLRDGTPLSFEEGSILRLRPDSEWEIVAEIDYSAFAVATNGTVWLVSDVKNQPILWQANLSTQP